MKDGLMETGRYPWVREQSYAQWVASALKRARASSGRIHTLFDSSVPEPRDLLRGLMADGVHPEFSDYFTSAFGDGNPYVVDMLARKYGVDKGRIVCTAGATGSMSLIYRALARPGDHILIESPGFDLFADLATIQGVEAEAIERVGADFALDLDRIEARLRPSTRLIVLSNLHNPSGMAIAHDMLVDLAALAERRGVIVAVDEVYGDYADATVRPCAAAAISDHFVSISSLTKIYGLGSLRCGWIVASEDIVGKVRDVSARVDFNVSTISHAISAIVLANAPAFDAYSDAVVGTARPVFDRWFAELEREGLVAGRLPDHGCICFPRLPTITDTEAFSEWLAATSGVIVAPGECFAAPGHVRIGFAQSPADLDHGLDALAAGIRRFSARAAAAIC